MDNVYKNLIDIVIKGLALFFGLVVFLFAILGEKVDEYPYIYEFYYNRYLYGDYEESYYFLFLFLFSYIEMLTLFYLRDKTINNVATHIISSIYSFIVTFILYLNIDDCSEEYSCKFSGFVWLLFATEITLLILTYKEKDLRKKLPNKQIFKFKKKQNDNEKNNNDNLNSNQNSTKMQYIEQSNVIITDKRQRMFSHPFSFIGRIRRLEYVISFTLIYMPLSFLLSAITNKDPLAGLIFNIPVLWFITVQGIKRCHDLGKSGWYQLIPFYIFFMLFEEGDIYINKYGPNPKGK